MNLILLLVFAAVLVSGCIGGDNEQTYAVTSTVTTIPITSTTVSSSSTTTSSTTSTVVDEKSCEGVCQGDGFTGGYCRRNRMECQLNNEVRTRAGSRYCPDMKYDICCCFNEDGLDHENVSTHYIFWTVT